MSSAALRARCATQPQRTERSVASAEDDARHAPGMLAEGDDWSARRHSERTDRPLPREVVRELSRKSDMQVCGRLRQALPCVTTHSGLAGITLRLGGPCGFGRAGLTVCVCRCRV
eukprot:COSAG01_NODE_4591_length_4892_cov_69.289589_4_plen_115_part_00